MDNTEKQIQRLRDEIKQRVDQIRWLRAHAAQINQLPAESIKVASWGRKIDLDNLEHKDVIAVIRALGGKWKKTATIGVEGRIDYQSEIDGMEVRCWAGKPPPSCRLVEIEVDVPEKVIPAHKEKVTRMICTGDEPVMVAMSRVATPQS